MMPSESVEAARCAALTLPPIFHWVILEGRLTGDRPRVDLMASIVDSPGSREALAAALESSRSHLLEGARPLLSAWSAPSSHRRQRTMERTPLLWLEWDAPFDRPALQLPFIDPRFWGPPGAAVASPEELVELIDGGYEASFGEPHNRSTLAEFERLISALPRSARALAAASLRPRGIDRDRLFAGVPQPLVLPWLDSIGWPGDRERVRRWLPRIVAPWEEAFLQIELDGDGPNAYLGIEPRQTELRTVDLRERSRLLEHLVAEGLSDRPRVDAVHAWTHAPPPPEADSRTVRSVHLKCVFHPEAPIEVKAYLGLHLRQTRARRSRQAEREPLAMSPA